MAAAQTYIIGENKVFAYENNLHYENHSYHLLEIYGEHNSNGFLPFKFINDGFCVIDIAKHDYLGSIYLPDDLSVFQKNWLLDRASYFDKIKWNMWSYEKNSDDVLFSRVVEEIKIKKIKERN